jgi:hypothetical protein
MKNAGVRISILYGQQVRGTRLIERLSEVVVSESPDGGDSFAVFVGRTEPLDGVYDSVLARCGSRAVRWARGCVSAAASGPVAVHPAWRTDEATAAAVLAATRDARTPAPLREAQRLARARGPSVGHPAR